MPVLAQRGATVIPDAVVSRITAQAAREALGGRGSRSPKRLDLGDPHASATVHDGSARLEISVDLPYPVDIAGACGEIRHHIAERVSHLTGMRIDDIEVTVEHLVPGESLRRGRVH